MGYSKSLPTLHQSPARMPKPSQLHQFLLLPENRSAHRALENLSKSLQQKRGKRLFLYGPSGTGKSHLISQALLEYRQSKPKIKYRRVTASEFAAQLADASAAGGVPEFQQQYRDLDLLICEDLQALQKRTESQRQLVLCLDEIETKGTVAIVSSTTLPGRWQNINRKLIDRCRAALSIEVALPSPQSRVRLCRHFAQLIHEPMPASVAECIAQTIQGSPRDLHSVIARLVEDAHRRKCKLSDEYVAQFLESEIVAPVLPMKIIIQVTARYFTLKVADLKSSSRRSDIVHARQVAMYMLREMTTHTQIEIAKTMGKADHTSVVRACQKVEELMSNDSRAQQELLELRATLSAG